MKVQRRKYEVGTTRRPLLNFLNIKLVLGGLGSVSRSIIAEGSADGGLGGTSALDEKL